jgi:uracil phosphoribosyltransferase
MSGGGIGELSDCMIKFTPIEDTDQNPKTRQPSGRYISEGKFRRLAISRVSRQKRKNRRSPPMTDTPEHLKIVDHPLVQHKLTIMRDRDTPTAVFRQLLREISQLLAYEVTRGLPMTTKRITTPMQEMDAPTLDGKKLALISILRAGNGLLDGVLELVPSARVGFVGLYRDEKTLQPVQYYFKVPEGLDDRLVIAVDPMLATGNSSAAAIDLLKQAGATNIRFLCLLAAPEGVARMKEAHPDVPIVTAAVDEALNEVGYIVPGLGDAGDRMFGTK